MRPPKVAYISQGYDDTEKPMLVQNVTSQIHIYTIYFMYFLQTKDYAYLFTTSHRRICNPLNLSLAKYTCIPNRKIDIYLE